MIRRVTAQERGEGHHVLGLAQPSARIPGATRATYASSTEARMPGAPFDLLSALAAKLDLVLAGLAAR